MKGQWKVGILFFLSITLFLFGYVRIKASNINLGSQEGGFGGSGTNSYYWKTDDYGVRFTVVDRATGERKTKSIDYYKLSAGKSGEVYHTKGKNKLEYMYVTPKADIDIKRNDKYDEKKGGYAFHKSDLWNVISTRTARKTSVKDIKKKWLSSEKFLKGIANDMGITLDTLKAKENMLIFEPILYIYFGGKYMALTSTEIALYDIEARKNSKPTIRYYFHSFSHAAIPISAYLKKEKFEIKPYKGKLRTFTDAEIVAQMGIGMVTSGKRPKKKKIKAVGTDYVYRTNTDVYTSLSVNASYDVSPDNPIRVDFHIPDVGTKSHTIYYLPKGYSQIAFVKWRTYEEERDVSILVSVNGMPIKELLVSVSKIPPWEPLNPRADDERPINLNGFNPNYNPESSPLAKEDLVKTETSRRWWEWFGEYQPRGDFLYWKANPIYDSIRVGKYSYLIVVGYYYTAQWEEIPYWSYGKHEYTISTSPEGDKVRHVVNGKIPTDPKYYNIKIDHRSKMTMKPAQTAKRANKDEHSIKSGYGIESEIQMILTGNGYQECTGFQNSKFLFPEFNYEKYWRLGDLKSHIHSGFNEITDIITLPKNNYSYSKWAGQTEGRFHFLPIWYPDGKYKLYADVFDCWTPAGHLGTSLTDDIECKGALWDDWHLRRLE